MYFAVSLFGIALIVCGFLLGGSSVKLGGLLILLGIALTNGVIGWHLCESFQNMRSKN